MGMGAGVLDRLVKENLGHVSTFTDGEKKKGLDRGRTRETECSLVFVCDVTFAFSTQSSLPLFPPSLSVSLSGGHAQQRKAKMVRVLRCSFPFISPRLL